LGKGKILYWQYGREREDVMEAGLKKVRNV
jgi:hypothetical protein